MSVGSVSITNSAQAGSVTWSVSPVNSGVSFDGTTLTYSASGVTALYGAVTYTLTATNTNIGGTPLSGSATIAVAKPYIRFTSLGANDFNLPSGTYAYIIVAGGGRGAPAIEGKIGGGGGGGEVLTSTTSLSGNYQAFVGDGGIAPVAGGDGQDSYLAPQPFGLIALARGGKAGLNPVGTGTSSPGGAGGNSGNGNVGGSPGPVLPNGRNPAGGGGGAAMSGQNGGTGVFGGTQGGAGGSGISVSFPGNTLIVGGGGGGSGGVAGPGTDGGGQGGSCADSSGAFPASGTAGTGGGGGGGTYTIAADSGFLKQPGNGGTGTVILYNTA